MSLSTLPNRIGYTGDGVTTAFSFPYKFQANGDLVVLSVDPVTEIETELVEDTDYTVAGAGVDAGGTVTLTVALTTGLKLVIYRDTPEIQTYSPQFNGPLPVPTLGDSLDKLGMMIQRLMDMASRSLRLPDGKTDSFDPRLPKLLASNPGRALLINDTGDGLQLGPDASDIADAEANAAAALASQVAAAASATAAAASAAAAAASAAWDQTNFTFNANQAATNLTGETFDGVSFSSVEVHYEAQRTGCFVNGVFFLQYLSGIWRLILSEEDYDPSLSVPHGLTFSLSQAGSVGQLKLAADNSVAGTGTLKIRKMQYAA